MTKLVEKVLENLPTDVFTDEMVANLLPGTPDSRQAIIKRAISRGDILHIKRGVYALAKKFQRKGIDLFVLSQLIHGPSYVSFESALSRHGLIPEAVYAVTCASATYARRYSTPLGDFIYKRIPVPMLFLGVKRIETAQGSYLLADPAKALADYVYVRKDEWGSVNPVLDSLRIEKERLKGIDPEQLDHLQEIYANSRVRRMLAGLKKEISR
jgi:predicted transcriptional regulator of viral defense system